MIASYTVHVIFYPDLEDIGKNSEIMFRFEGDRDTCLILIRNACGEHVNFGIRRKHVLESHAGGVHILYCKSLLAQAYTDGEPCPLNFIGPSVPVKPAVFYLLVEKPECSAQYFIYNRFNILDILLIPERFVVYSLKPVRFLFVLLPRNCKRK